MANLENVPRLLEKNVSSAVLGYIVLQMSGRSRKFIVLFKSSTPLLISCLVFLSVIESVLLRSLIITVELSSFLSVLSGFF